MKRRMLGNTGIEVPAVGMGAWQLGDTAAWGEMSDKEAIELVHSALDLGCDFFDTAPPYGRGRSEELLGEALKGKREKATICTKFGYTAKQECDFSAGAIRKSVEDSLKRLQTDYLDILLIHSPAFELIDGEQPHYKELEKLKKEGLVRSYGMSLADSNAKEMREFIDKNPGEVIELRFNIFHQEALEAFSAAKERGIGLIGNIPLDSGWLSGNYSASSQFTGSRSRWTKEQKEQRAAFIEKLKSMIPASVSLAEIACAYVLAQPEIGTIIPGVKNRTQLQNNLAVADIVPDEELIQKIYTFWQAEIKGNPVPW